MRPQSVHLVDGTEIQDRRLDRCVQFDERSRAFPIRAVIEGKKPRSYTWRCAQVLDQGTEGACVGFGVTHELMARPAEVLLLYPTKYAYDLYWAAQRLDEWPGGSYPGAKPKYEGTSVLAGVKAAKAEGWFGEYRWAFSFRDLVLGVGRNGPAIMGTNWYAGMLKTDSHGYLHPTGYLAGGHCYLAVGVNIPARRFTILNSWGWGWGLNGQAYISFRDMERLLSERGEAAFLMRRTTKAKSK